MRITAGSLRGKRLEAPPGQDVRPTSDRAREALFNVLIHRFQGDGRFTLVGARVLDACAGTGALGLEALSRGAAHVTFLERDPACVRRLQALIRDWGVAGNTTVTRADVTRPPHAPTPCSLILMDPPYNQGIPPPALDALTRGGWIAPDALCVVETDRPEPLDPPPGFTLEDDRAQGRARLRIFRQAAT